MRFASMLFDFKEISIFIIHTLYVIFYLIIDKIRNRRENAWLLNYNARNLTRIKKSARTNNHARLYRYQRKESTS